MSLPKLTVMKHKLILPSTGESITFRPFLVKEEKILMMALQSENQEDMTRALKEIINNCIESQLNIDTLPMFDIEYIFLQLRARSVGDQIEVKYTDPDKICKNEEECKFESSINIDDIKIVKTENHTDLVTLTDKIKVKMKYPAMAMANNLQDIEQADMVDSTFKMISACIDYIMDGEQMHKTSDYTEDEVNDFLNSLSSLQFKEIQTFFETAPKIKKEVTSTCGKCGTKDTKTLEGLADFFALG